MELNWQLNSVSNSFRLVDFFRFILAGIQRRNTTKFHTFHPKKYTKLHTIKKGEAPFHFVGFTESFGQMSNKYKGLGKRDPDPNPFLVLGL
jgi:hypothetical protein